MENHGKKYGLGNGSAGEKRRVWKGRDGTMSGMEFQTLHARNIPAYINLSHNDPAVANNIPRTWVPVAHGRRRKEGGGRQEAVRYLLILIAEVNISVGWRDRQVSWSAGCRVARKSDGSARVEERDGVVLVSDNTLPFGRSLRFSPEGLNFTSYVN